LNRYARLALLLLVLTLSVGMLSAAINILGDITRLELEEDKPGPINPMMDPGSLGKTSDEVDVTNVEPRKLGPIMELRLPPKTKYLRRMPAENYTAGTWYPVTSYAGESYEEDIIPDQTTGASSTINNQFYVDPLTVFTGWVTVAPSTQAVTEFNGSLTYYPEIQSFTSTEPFKDPYWVSHAIHGFSEAALRAAEPVSTEATLDIPSRIETRLRELALEITEDETSPYEKYKALESYLRDHYEFSEEFTQPPAGIDPVVWFLFNDRKGTGAHFNSALILMARSIGLPARAVIGFMIDPWAEHQYVLPQQAYLYAEANLGNVGWTIFDATPKHYDEGEVNITKEATFTNITGNDPVALKGKTFNVWGTVTNINGSAVSGPQVEIILKADKTDYNETGLVVGVGFVEEGFFNVTCDASTELAVGDYDLIAHTLENRWYLESVSDPPIRLMSETEVAISGPRRVYAEKNITYRGVVVETATGEPLVNVTLHVWYLNRTMDLVSDGQGRISFPALFPEEGEETIRMSMRETDYYVSSTTSFGVSVMLPPPSPDNLLALIFGFPQNIIIALSGALGVGVYAARRSRRLKEDEFTEPRVVLPAGRERIGYEDGAPLEYSNYEEGVVKLFNRFYVSMMRMYPDIDDAMTPREFEYILIDRLPVNAHAALEDLVTSYEIAMYSNMPVSVEDFKRTNATIELIVELMKNGS